MESLVSTTEYKDDFTKINLIRDKIECMSKFNQIEILRILTKRNVTINENKYGIHINLSELDDIILDDLLAYIKYVNTQEVELNNIEQQKQSYKNIYFLKDNKDNMTTTTNSKYVSKQ
jgi:hypothetical protein